MSNYSLHIALKKKIIFRRIFYIQTYVASGARISSLSRAYIRAVRPACLSPSKPKKWITFSRDGGKRLTHNWYIP